VEIQTGGGGGDNDKVIHENPRPGAQVADFAANVWGIREAPVPELNETIFIRAMP
jgi:hypothetical protein